jgi:MFS family permease
MPDDAGLLNGLQAVDSWNRFFDHPTGTTLGLYAASLYLPSIVTAYLGDYLSERFGRRFALAVGSFIVLAGGFINAFATNAGMWVAGNVYSSNPPSLMLTLTEVVPSWAAVGVSPRWQPRLSFRRLPIHDCDRCWPAATIHSSTLAVFCQPCFAVCALVMTYVPLSLPARR